MKFLTFKVQKEAGFRLNLTDMLFAVLLFGAAGGVYDSFGTYYSLYLLPLYIGVTFFLFCNLFRVGTRVELLWIGFFFISVIAGFLLFDKAWFVAAAVSSSMLQAVLIALTIRSEDYHGIFCCKER